jgi:hypothetical protein
MTGSARTGRLELARLVRTFPRAGMQTEVRDARDSGYDDETKYPALDYRCSANDAGGAPILRDTLSAASRTRLHR